MGQDLLLRAEGIEAGLRPATGGAFTHLTDLSGAQPVELLRRAAPGFTNVLDSAGFALVPFCNRVRDGRFSFGGREVRLSPNLPGQKHPLHGQGWRGAWAVADADDAFAELVFDHAPGEWPWAYQARLKVVLEDRGMTVTLSARNLSPETMPCGLGLHPYYPCDSRTVLDAEVQAVWTVDDEIMPVERVAADGRYDLKARRICGAGLDNGYDGWSGEALVTWPDKARALRIASAAPRFQVYAPAEGGLIAAEPVTNANGALNRPQDEWEGLGLRRLQPGETAVMSARFQALSL
ncbi:MAG: aldose 1-epimerase [Caulobacteraceae bacterium]|nr:aldose 1-epimerase [Caulobacteraceae bacterium]